MNARRRIPVQYLLPLLIIALLLTTMGVGSAMAYREVREASALAATERLERVASQLSDAFARSMRTSIDRYMEVAGDVEVRDLILRGATVTEFPDGLERLVPAPDTALPLELWSLDRDVVANLGRYPQQWDPDEAATARSLPDVTDSGGYGPVFFVGERPYVWITVPVRGPSGERLGYLARIVGFTNTNASQIDALVGSNTQLYVSNLHGGPWVSLGGDVLYAPIPPPLGTMARYTGEDGEDYMAHAAAIVGQPLAVVVQAPSRDALARPAIFLRRLIGGILLLLVIGAGGAWLVSRRITKPLGLLSEAASDLAAGDYSRRVTLDSNDELSDLAEAFSNMAEEVESGHAELEARYEEASDLVARLEESNRRMLEAMAIAEQARREAESANRAKSAFLATMSHEVRTPINAIVGYTELLQLEIAGPLTAEQHAQLDRVSTSSRHLLRLVDEVLDIASVEAGTLELATEEGGALATVGAACTMVAPEAAAKGLELSAAEDLDAETFYQGDPRRVRQILTNLLANAVKFTPSGGTIEVSASVDQPDDSSEAGWVRFVVADSGIGIHADQQELIFERFTQLESGLTRPHGGAGLGLTVSRGLARIMGGDLTVESEPGRGARFTLQLPLARTRATESA